MADAISTPVEQGPAAPDWAGVAAGLPGDAAGRVAGGGGLSAGRARRPRVVSVRLEVEVEHRDGRIPCCGEIEQAVVDLLEDMHLVDFGPDGDSVYEVVHAEAVEPPRA